MKTTRTNADDRPFTAETPRTRNTNLYCHPERSEGPAVSCTVKTPGLRTASQPRYHLRNFFHRPRVRQRLRRRRHALQPVRITNQRRNRVDQIGRTQIAFFDHHRGAHSFQRPGIHVLMIVSRSRKRYKNRRLARRRNLPHRARARAADQQIGAPERARHIVNKLVDFPRDSRLLISGQHMLIVALPRLMNDVNPGNPSEQPSQRLNHRLINGPCPLTASKNQQSRSAPNLRRNRKKRRAHRHACHLAVRKIPASFFKVHRRRRNPARDHSISKSRHHVRFKSQRRKPPPNRRHHSRSRSVSPHPNHHFRIKLRKHPGRSRNRPRQIKHRLRPSHQADIFQRPNLNQFQREPGLRHQPRLNPTSRPDKKYLGAELLLKLLSNSQCRNNVSARPAARDNNAHEIVFPEGTLADCGENRVSYLGYRFSDTVSSSKSAVPLGAGNPKSTFPVTCSSRLVRLDPPETSEQQPRNREVEHEVRRSCDPQIDVVYTTGRRNQSHESTRCPKGASYVF